MNMEDERLRQGNDDGAATALLPWTHGLYTALGSVVVLTGVDSGWTARLRV